MPLFLGKYMGVFRGKGALYLQSTLRKCVWNGQGGAGVVEKTRKGIGKYGKCSHRNMGEWHQEFFAQALQLFKLCQNLKFKI